MLQLESKKITEALKDADDNYRNNRYKDAAKMFQQISQALYDENQFLDSIYCVYATAVAFKKDEGSNVELIKALLNLADLASMTCLTFAREEIRTEQDPLKQIDILHAMQKSYKRLDNLEDRIPQLEAILKVIDVVLEGDFELEVKIRQSHKAIEISQELDLAAESYKKQLAELFEEQGDIILDKKKVQLLALEKNDFKPEVNMKTRSLLGLEQIASLYYKAAKLHQERNDKKMVERLIKKGKALQVNVDPKRFGVEDLR